MPPFIKHKIRVGVAVAGIVVGCAAIILLTSISQSAGLMVRQQLQNPGSSVLFVIPGSQQGRGVRLPPGSITTLVAADAEAMMAECPAVAAASPMVGSRAQVVAGNLNWLPDQVYGVNDKYPTIGAWQIGKGAFFTAADVHAAAKVCVIGKSIVNNLFPDTECLGATIRIMRVPFRVVGVLEPKGANLFGQDQDNILLAPFTTIKKRVSGSTFNNVDAILVSARSAEQMKPAQDEVTKLLRQRHRILGGADDFTVRNGSEAANMLDVLRIVATLSLGSLAGASLLVGGVGGMNLMLVSVTERRAEFALRPAGPARRRSIFRRFLLESVVLASAGGAIGVVLGVSTALGATLAVNRWVVGTRWPLSIHVAPIAGALLVSAAIGAVFGYYPARKASRLGANGVACVKEDG
jgi:putative ABC transport system permease protein